MLACARIGAVHSVVFGGFAPAELAARIDDAQPKVVVTASCGVEPSRVVEYKPMLEAAGARQQPHQPEVCVVLQREQARPSSASATSTGTSFDADRPPTPAPSASRSRRPTRSTSSTPPARPGSPRASSATTAATRSRCAGRWRTSTASRPGETWFTASDVGWVVGHSYIVYAPLLTGATTVLYEGKPVGTPDAGAFWRVIAEYGVVGDVHRADRLPRDQEGGPRRRAMAARVRPLVPAHPVPRRRAARPRHLRSGRPSVLGVPVVDNWWQTETGWPIAANLRGLEPMPIKPGSPSVPVPGYDVQVLDEHGAAGARRASRARSAIRLPLPPGTLPTLWGDDDRYVASYLVGLRRLLPDRRRRLHRRGRLPLRHGPHRRRHQRRRAPALDRVDRGGARRAPRRRRVRRDRGRRRAQGPGAARARGAQGRAWTPDADGERIRAELVQRVRDEVGAVAALRQVDIVAGAAQDPVRARSCARRCARSPTARTPAVPVDDRGRLGAGDA